MKQRFVESNHPRLDRRMRSYSPPHLEEYGSLAELTHGLGTAAPDGFIASQSGFAPARGPSLGPEWPPRDEST